MDVERFNVSNESAVVLNGSQYCRFDNFFNESAHKLFYIALWVLLIVIL